MDRYIRQTSLPGFGDAAQQRLQDAHVVCVGAGGLGSPVLLYLAAAGVGTITIVDDDVVDESNLQRQIIHSTQAVGTPKVVEAARRIAELNPCVTVHAQQRRLTWPESLTLCAGADVIVDGSDNIDTRHVCSTTAARLGIPHVWASILGFDGQLSVFHRDRVVYEDVFPTPPLPGDIPSCSQAGVLGPVVGVLGSAMALEVIKCLTGVGEPLIGTIAYYAGLSGSWDYIPLTGNPARAHALLVEDPAATLTAPETDLLAGRALVDVREPDEYAAGHLPGAQLLPLSQLEKNPAEAAALIPADAVIYCQAGLRSQKAVLLLRSVGRDDLLSLRGGYAQWRTHPTT